ncbi:unnamed protein product [Parascedosporium putredinis]|uniref:Uncharacterized protein n=1 Tax=Parascedosporium putredinis TaxID=1442378 RepID=A0A9P1MFC3_9PEZI|nr:unnamed protein product [Parascedosporium putredinis]CAI8003177.1 unnamed protein product [Parascedosporium putredinis]
MPPANRLTFLYPRLARALREAEPLTRTRPSLVSQPAANRRHTTNTRRHGKAVQFKSAKDAEANQAKETTTAAAAPPPPPLPSPHRRARTLHRRPTSKGVLARPPPLPFSHFFDSYAMVNRLVEAGYARPQSVTMMKAMRELLRDKMTAAQEDLVSKSDVDNVNRAFPLFPPLKSFSRRGNELTLYFLNAQETYLFKAACSELSTEVKNNRRAADEVMREQRMRLQHEVDVIWQTLNHELLTLKDTVRGLFDDRKMAVREEQRPTLAPDMKSDIEGLRWILIRRSALGIAFMAVVSLATLRYAAYVKQQRKEEAEKSRRQEEERRKMFAGAGEVRGPVTDPDEILATA